jgi:predicted aconitase
MELSKDDRRLLNGEEGEPKAFAMRVLEKFGEATGADRMIPIASAHLVACSYTSVGEAGIEIYSRLVDQGAKVAVPTTLNPASVDFRRWEAHRIPKNYAERQMILVDLVERMGAIPIWSCTPYYHLNVPRFGQIVAWAESSAVGFINSVIGARTNRMSAYVDLCAALAGRMPRFGLYLTENRAGQFLIKIHPDLNADFKSQYYPALGYLMGMVAKERIPVIDGLSDATFDQLKLMCAAAASSGSVAIFHIVGITPEARTREEAFQGQEPEEVVEVGVKEIKEVIRAMSTYTGEKVDTVAIGCPHASIDQLRQYAELLDGKKVHEGTVLWICTSQTTEAIAEKMGYMEVLKRAGATIVTDTCINNPPWSEWGFDSLLTDSGKFAYYTPSTVGSKCHFTSTEQCIRAAISGRIEEEAE